MSEETLLHATCIALGEAGIVILGPPGAGKSDLALRLLDQPGRGLSGKTRTAQLVADDQVVVARRGGALFASPPAILAGKIEVRGLGIATVPFRPSVKLALAVRLTAATAIERLPDPMESSLDILGVSLPLVLVDGAAASAPARLRAALDWFGAP